eukprot:366395-Chlamydomonas_euryale.AAC.7
MGVASLCPRVDGRARAARRVGVEAATAGKMRRTSTGRLERPAREPARRRPCAEWIAPSDSHGTGRRVLAIAWHAAVRFGATAPTSAVSEAHTVSTQKMLSALSLRTELGCLQPRSLS